MTDVLRWGVPLFGGAIIGLLHFGGLWATVRRLPSTRRPALLAFTSLVVRVGVAVTGFVLLMAGDARRLTIALVGFLAVRTLAVRHTRVHPETAQGR